MAEDLGRPMSRTGLRPAHLCLLAICTLGFLVDVGEIAIASALGAIFSAAKSTTQVSLMLSSTYVGGAIGAIGFGLLAKRFSPQLAISLAMAVLGAASFAAAFAPGMTVLIAARAVGGLGIGAYPPLAVALLTVHLPARWRGTLTLVASALGSLGGPLIIYGTRYLSQHPVGGFAGWQSALLAGAIGAVIVSIGFALLRGLDRTAAPAPVSITPEPVQTRAHRLTARVILPLLYVMVHWASVGFPLLSGVILLGKGFNLNDALLFVAAMMVGPTIGTLASGIVIDRVARRDAILGTLIVGALALVAFGASDTAWILGLAAVTFGIALGLYVPVMSLYAAEFYPRETRSAATGRLWAMNRVSVAIAPLVLLPLLHNAGALVLTLVLAAILIACAMLIRLAPPGYAGEELI